MSAFIAQYPDTLAPAVCTQIIARFDADPRKVPGAIVGIGTPKRSTDLGVSRLAGWEDLASPLNHAVVSSAMRYRDEHPAFRRLHRDILHTGYQIQLYRAGTGDAFDWHADVINAATANRILAMVLYLNTVDVGGETEFRAQALAIEPRAGTAIWFPPSFAYLHAGHPPVSGPKYVVTTFLIE